MPTGSGLDSQDKAPVLSPALAEWGGLGHLLAV